MANKNYTQYILLAAIAVFIVVGIANYGSPSGYSVDGVEMQSDRNDVKEYVCEWGDGARDPATGIRPGGGWHWIGETYDRAWVLSPLLSKAEAYCNDGFWTCTDLDGNSILSSTGVAKCTRATEWAVCFCRR